MLRRQVELGLSEPIIAHRFWLWAVGSGAQVVGFALDLVCWYAIGTALSTTAIGLHVTSLMGLVGIVAIALAFFPPAAYVDFIQRRSSTSAVGEVA